MGVRHTAIQRDKMTDKLNNLRSTANKRPLFRKSLAKSHSLMSRSKLYYGLVLTIFNLANRYSERDYFYQSAVIKLIKQYEEDERVGRVPPFVIIQCV